MPKKKENQKKEKKYLYPKKESSNNERTKLKKTKNISNLNNAELPIKNKYQKRNWKQYLEGEKLEEKEFNLKRNKLEIETTDINNQKEKEEDNDKESNILNIKKDTKEFENNNIIEFNKNKTNVQKEKSIPEEKKDNQKSDNRIEYSNTLNIDTNNYSSNWKNLFEDNFNELMNNEDIENLEASNSEIEDNEEDDSESYKNKHLENKALEHLNKDIETNKINESKPLLITEKDKSFNMKKQFQNLKIETNYIEFNNNENKISSEKIKFTLNSNIIKKEKEGSILSSNNENNFQNNLINTKESIKSYIEEKYIKHNSEDTIIFNGKIFKRYEKANKYKTKDNLIRVIYKCNNYRKYEKFRSGIKHNTFCNATIVYILPNQKKKSGYIFKRDHSDECNNLSKDNNNFNYKDKENLKLGKKFFIEECEKIMNNSSIYDRTLFKNQFKDLYNKNKYNFEIDNNFLSNIITKWKQKSNRFTKYCVLDNVYDYQNRLFLRDFRNLYI